MKNDQYISNLLGAFATTVATHIEQEITEQGGRNLTHESALVAIHNHADDTIDTLSKVLGLTHSGAVRLTNTLEKEGLIERHKSDQDARAVVLRITPKGSRRAAKVLEARAKVTEQVLANLSPKQQRTLVTIMKASLSSLTSDYEGARSICRLCDEQTCRPEGCPVESAVN